MPYRDPEAQRKYSREYGRRWRAAHPERVKARGKQYRERNLERARETGRRSYWKNVERNRANDRHASRAHMPAPTRPEPSLCEICGVAPGIALCLDHCHLTDRFRGWVCKHCNLMLGYARDSAVILTKAAGYIERAYK